MSTFAVSLTVVEYLICREAFVEKFVESIPMANTQQEGLTSTRKYSQRPRTTYLSWTIHEAIYQSGETESFRKVTEFIGHRTGNENMGYMQSHLYQFRLFKHLS